MVRQLDNSRAEGLHDARRTARASDYLAEIWRRREYIVYVAKSELRSRQINSILGNLWHLINPLLQVAVFFLFFGLILDVQRGVDNFLAYLTIGIFVYGYSQKCATTGARSLVKYRGLVQMITFPRATVPLTTTVTEAFATLPAYAVMLALIVLTGDAPSPTWFLIVPFFALQTCFNAGLAMVTARAVHHVADIQQVLPFVFRLGFYFSGVLFNVNAYIENTSYQIIFDLNPLYCFLEIYRGALLENYPIRWELVGIGTAWSFGLLAVGFWWFRRAEDSYGQA